MCTCPHYEFLNRINSILRYKQQEVINMGKARNCAICGKQNISRWHSPLITTQYYCSFSCYAKGQRYYHLVFASVFSIGSTSILLAMIYDVAINHFEAITPYINIIIPIFTLTIIFLAITVFGFSSKIKRFENTTSK